MDDNNTYQPQSNNQHDQHGQPHHEQGHGNHNNNGHHDYTQQPQFISPMPEYTPPAPQSAQQLSNNSPSADDISPIAVVQALSVRGVEYWMMSMTLYLGAAGFLGILLALINGGISFQILSFPISLLIVCLPLFSYLFLRLKKAELANPKLKLDPSKRKLTQFTQVITFAISLFDIIGIVFAVLATVAGHGFGPLWKYLLNSAVVLAVAGGILAYYWIDEHRGRN
jgi:hypothetical protein